MSVKAAARCAVVEADCAQRDDSNPLLFVCDEQCNNDESVVLNCVLDRREIRDALQMSPPLALDLPLALDRCSTCMLRNNTAGTKCPPPPLSADLLAQIRFGSGE
ncbi:hypothetical protein Q1695_012735 [Nippostrongylus brasiliensis]|nr:hypothetical protein Q1695_012735 [Nippostrongylus brasiliensis]